MIRAVSGVDSATVGLAVAGGVLGGAIAGAAASRGIAGALGSAPEVTPEPVAPPPAPVPAKPFWQAFPLPGRQDPPPKPLIVFKQTSVTAPRTSPRGVGGTRGTGGTQGTGGSSASAASTASTSLSSPAAGGKPSDANRQLALGVAFLGGLALFFSSMSLLSSEVRREIKKCPSAFHQGLKQPSAILAQPLTFYIVLVH